MRKIEKVVLGFLSLLLIRPLYPQDAGRETNPGIVIGEFTLEKVIDGDTIKVKGLEKPIRLLHIDTEETFKSTTDKRLFEMGWDVYLRAKQGKRSLPVKMATPMGEEAYRFAKDFFSNAKKIRLERDSEMDDKDRYGRFIAYALVERDGRWVNYNIECVRAGMSPYFVKYGFSRRFHEQFMDAQNEAMRNKKGIWGSEIRHYPDYDNRLLWWTARAKFIKSFELESKGRQEYIDLGWFDADHRLNAMLGKEVVLFGIIGDVKRPDKGPIKVSISRKEDLEVPLVFYEKKILDQLKLKNFRGEFVIVRGKLTQFDIRGKKETQMVIRSPDQVIINPGLPEFVGEGLDEAEKKEAEQ